ncbi:hypothetical protein GIX45_18790 [Erwinia sp. CPCC 100877]|nr:hypothetical protein [Erwinia sp. CPCC 100877]
MGSKLRRKKKYADAAMAADSESFYYRVWHKYAGRYTTQNSLALVFKGKGMNYQTTSLFFYSGKIFLGALLCLSLVYWDVTAPVFYLLMTGIVFPVAISLRLHTLAERGVMFHPKVSSEWMVYVHGIPVRETRSVLSNPGSFSPEKLRAFFIRAFGIKCCMQLSRFSFSFCTASGVVSMLIWRYSLIPGKLLKNLPQAAVYGITAIWHGGERYPLRWTDYWHCNRGSL